MALTDTRIRTAKSAEKPYKLTDGGGLCLEVRPTGSKLWRLRYRLSGKENVYALGEYPLIGLAEARAARDQAKKLIKQGIHPAHNRKLSRAHRAAEHANTFEAVAREWLAHHAGHWTPRTYRQRRQALERDVFPHIGALPVRQVTPAHVLEVVRRIESRAPAMAAIVNQAIGAISRHACATLRADTDPTQPLRGSLKPRATEHHKPLTAAELPDFIQAIDAYPGHFSNRVALHLVLLTLVRTTEALGARWTEIDFERGEWRIPAERMKMRDPHIVPLSRQALDWLRRLSAVTGSGEYLFPHRAAPRKPVSQGVLWKAVASMGYQGRFSPHGIRATGSTLLNEMGFRADLIERQLAHAERSKSRAAYNHAQYLPERREMMQTWADYLDSLVAGASVIPLRRAAV